MNIKAQIAMVMNLDKCLGCHNCSVTCKNVWTNRSGAEYMWFNNVETRPGPGYPRRWEDQTRYRGGWTLKNGKLRLLSGGPVSKLLTIFYNPDLPTLDEYYDPWTYSYGDLLGSEKKRHVPVARPHSAITGKPIDAPKWGPNWNDDLAGGSGLAKTDPNLVSLQKEIAFQYEQTFMMYLPRICEHCLNPACVAACPAGAIYKRDEDGIVLVDQEACRGWRFCVSACPYKKIYFNWKTHKSEKCTFCYPRIEAGLPTICSETCVGRIRYLGPILYDADRVQEAASVMDEKDLYRSQLNIFLDPFDEEVVREAKRSGINDSWIQAARRSPVYMMAIKWRIALPLHPEYRTLPMVWYVPPLSPIQGNIETEGPLDASSIESLIDMMQIPQEYLASMLTAGDVSVVREVLLKLMAMRSLMESRTLGTEFDEGILKRIGMSLEDLLEMQRLLAIAKYEERFVIPTANTDGIEDLSRRQGACSLEGIAPPEGVQTTSYVLRRRS